MKVVYLHHLPVTSGRANALQVMHMCQAFGRIAETELIVPRTTDLKSVRGAIAAELGEDLTFRVSDFTRFSVAGRLAAIGAFIGARRALAARRGTDLCMTRNPVMAWLAVRSDVPTVYETHDEVLHPTVGWIDRWYRGGVRRASQSPRWLGLVAISDALARAWEKRGFPRTGISVLHDGVAAEQYRELPSIEAARRDLDLPSDLPIVVYAGSLYADREVGVVIELARRIPRFRFVIVGGPEPERAAFARAVAGEGLTNVTFVGRVPHARVKSYLAAADALLMLWSWQVPTIHICSPLKVFEYMAAGRSIVGYGFPTIREVLADGETAYLAEPGDVTGLADRLTDAIDNPAPAVSLRARTLALEKFSWDKRARSILALAERR